jgi:2',3'-cyclic-nucleotide 2'-phosphodiesterase (5'-nucleotidase family)
MNANQNKKKFVILTTNDMHSSFTGSGGADYDLESEKRVGGYARLATSINLLRQFYENNGYAVLVLDAGDFYSGSLYQLLAPSKKVKWAPEVEFFSNMRYDACTLGNHDFEAGEESLLTMFVKLELLEQKLQFVSSNLRVRNIEDTKVSDIDSLIQTQSFAKQIREKVKDFIIIEKNDIKFGILGAMGPDAAFSCSGTRKFVSFIGYEDQGQNKKFDLYVDYIVEQATRLRSQVDVVILLAHQGTPEDVDLAKAIPANLIDIMISGHTHETYFKRQKGNSKFFDLGKFSTTAHETYLTQSQSHGKRLGVNAFQIIIHTALHNKKQIAPLSLTPDDISIQKICKQPLIIEEEKEGEREETEILLNFLLKQVCDNGHFLDINKKIKPDKTMTKMIENWMEDIMEAKVTSMHEGDSKYYHYKINQIVYESPSTESKEEDIFPLPSVNRVTIANTFCTMALKEINEHHLGDGRQPLQVYLHAPKAMRDILLPLSNQKYVIQYSDIFRILSMTGSSPVCSFYLSIEAVTMLIEIVPILRAIFSPEIAMCFSNSLTWKESEWGIPFINKVYDVQINGATLESGSLVHIATNYFIGEWFWKVKEITHGIIDLKPMNSLGEVITDKATSIIKPYIYEPDLVCGALEKVVNSRA